MRLLADENLPRFAIDALRALGHDVLWIAEAFPSVKDDEVLAIAIAEQRVLITLDKDFGELVVRRGLSPSTGVILLRVPNVPSVVVEVITRALATTSDFTGRFVIVDEHRVRERRR